eukprot:TRINITY_DN56120_c0_g1_i1.p1 TRINITY_DN56120_c0_g1~~TRINITY_DN56120_c0_g1_i1.p1  ORF type:complete len:236 (+),score=16.12 TRINITY_DN56120_c0_g1_i1:42-749(+)
MCMAGRVFPFPTSKVSKIICVAWNYVAHAAELNNALPSQPTFFLKPPSSLTTSGVILIPPGTGNLHHEVELGVMIGKRGKNISRANALSHVAGYTVALDMTARDLQSAAKQHGLPWTEAKGYDTFCPVGDIIPAQRVSNPQRLKLYLNVNGREVQRSETSLMVVGVAEQIAHASRIMTLEEGDFLLTGTPAGVGQVHSGAVLVGGIEGLVEIQCTVQDSPLCPSATTPTSPHFDC